MIKPVTMYSIVCNRCGKTFIDEFNGIVAWLDEGTAKEQAMESEWIDDKFCGCINLPKGSIKKLIGKDLSWSDEPVELK